MDIGEKIKILRKQKKMRQEDVAKLSGIHQSTISSYELGNINPSLEAIRELSRVLEVDADYLEDNTKKNYEKSDLIPHEAINEMPLLSGTVSASTFTHSFNDWEGETVAVPIKNLSNKVAWRVQGRSMEPEVLDGELVVIEKIDRFSNDDWVIAENDDGVTIKVFKELADGSVELRPLNPSFATLHFKNSEDKRLEILGKVIWHLKKPGKRKK